MLALISNYAACQQRSQQLGKDVHQSEATADNNDDYDVGDDDDVGAVKTCLMQKQEMYWLLHKNRQLNTHIQNSENRSQV